MRDREFMLLFGTISAPSLCLLRFHCRHLWGASRCSCDVDGVLPFCRKRSERIDGDDRPRACHDRSDQRGVKVFLSIPAVAALLAGGALSGCSKTRAPIRPSVFFFCGRRDHDHGRRLFGMEAERRFRQSAHRTRVGRHPVADLKRLMRHWPIYSALLIWLLWNFAPGSATPLQYHLQNTLHASDAQWGQWNAIFAASFVPTYVAYGASLPEVRINSLLWWGTVIAIPQMVPLLFIHSVTGALIAAVPIGLMGGIATGAYLDLIMRACPRGLEGTTLMLASSLYFLVSRFGDVLGTRLYDRYGDFDVCVIAITVVYALMLPALLLVPRAIDRLGGRATPCSSIMIFLFAALDMWSDNIAAAENLSPMRGTAALLLAFPVPKRCSKPDIEMAELDRGNPRRATMNPVTVELPARF